MSQMSNGPNLGVSASSPELTSLFKKVLKSNGITEPVSEVVVTGSGLKGENFGGLTEYVTVNFDNPGENKPLHLFVKKKTETETFNKLLDEFQAYQKEAVFFMEYLPRAREYCKSVGHEELMNIYPKCYYGDDHMLILENLVVGRGFILLNKEEPQDFATARFALTTLAKHHAISHAIIKELGGAESFFEIYPKLRFEAFLTDVARDLNGPYLEKAITTNINILEKCDIYGRDDAIKKLRSWKGKGLGQVMEALKSSPGNFLVLNHGDYWNNNMMFKKEPETDMVLEHVIFDFQIMRYASPCVDVGHYLFSSVKPDVRRGQLRELLSIYLDALKFAGHELGHPVDMTLEELEADFCKHFYEGYWTAMSLATGPGYEVLKDIDIAETQDMTKMIEMFDHLVLKWIDEHPKECKRKAENIIEYVKEHERLSNAII